MTRAAAAGRTTCVLDVETAPRRDAGAGHRDGVAAADTLSNHALVCASVLIVDEDGEGTPGSIELHSREALADEAGLLQWIERLLPDPSDGGRLVTFNGIGHDLVALRSRAMATWSFRMPKLALWSAGGGEHVDLMLALSQDGRARWPSLAAACGALGVPAKALPPRARRDARATLLSNQCDVVATHLLHLHLRAFSGSDGGVLARGWLALAAALGGGEAPEHLLPYSTHPNLRVAARLAALGDGGRNAPRRRTPR